MNRWVKQLLWIVATIGFSPWAVSCTIDYEEAMSKLSADALFLRGMQDFDVVFVGRLFDVFGEFDPREVFNTNSGFVFKVDRVIKGSLSPYVSGPQATVCGMTRLHSQLKDETYRALSFDMGKQYLILGTVSGDDFYFYGSRSLLQSTQVLLEYEFIQQTK